MPGHEPAHPAERPHCLIHGRRQFASWVAFGRPAGCRGPSLLVHESGRDTLRPEPFERCQATNHGRGAKRVGFQARGRRHRDRPPHGLGRAAEAGIKDVVDNGLVMRPAPLLRAGRGKRESGFQCDALARIRRKILDKDLPWSRPCGGRGPGSGGRQVSAEADQHPAAQAGMHSAAAKIRRDGLGSCAQSSRRSPEPSASVRQGDA